MRKLLIPLLLLTITSVSADAKWRVANEKELRAVIPARVNVENERIETEFRTASGVTDGNGKVIAGVVMITAGYAAEGKYTHFFMTKVGLKFGDLELKPGEYVFGHKRIDPNTQLVSFYEAATGKALGTVKAQLDPKKGPVRSLTITPPGSEKAVIKIGRFYFEYSIVG
jgi:hypothetical protein